MADTKTRMSISPSTLSKLQILTDWMMAAKQVVWFTGAGISTESGLSDYRGPDGVWTRRDKGLPPLPSRGMDQVTPNKAHDAILRFEQLGKCSFLISQNVDDLHLSSGYPFEKISELHGNVRRVRCVDPCDRTFSVDDWPEIVWTPRDRRSKSFGQPCPTCGGPLVNSVIDFGMSMPVRDTERAFEQGGLSDLFIVVGSSLRVTPAADIPLRALDNGARLVIMNIGDTPLDDLAHLRFDQDKVGVLLPALLDYVESHKLR